MQKDYYVIMNNEEIIFTFHGKEDAVEIYNALCKQSDIYKKENLAIYHLTKVEA